MNITNIRITEIDRKTPENIFAYFSNISLRVFVIEYSLNIPYILAI